LGVNFWTFNATVTGTAAGRGSGLSSNISGGVTPITYATGGPVAYTGIVTYGIHAEAATANTGNGGRGGWNGKGGQGGSGIVIVRIPLPTN
jgi:hypothetical protein